jgi:hypothetical protein
VRRALKVRRGPQAQPVLKVRRDRLGRQARKDFKARPARSGLLDLRA